ncbi:MAG: hypothetical protein Q9227_001233 [Pyrenula ochraceoflavens]
MAMFKEASTSKVQLAPKSTPDGLSAVGKNSVHTGSTATSSTSSLLSTPADAQDNESTVAGDDLDVGQLTSTTTSMSSYLVSTPACTPTASVDSITFEQLEFNTPNVPRRSYTRIREPRFVDQSAFTDHRKPTQQSPPETYRFLHTFSQTVGSFGRALSNNFARPIWAGLRKISDNNIAGSVPIAPSSTTGVNGSSFSGPTASRGLRYGNDGLYPFYLSGQKVTNKSNMYYAACTPGHNAGQGIDGSSHAGALKEGIGGESNRTYSIRTWGSKAKYKSEGSCSIHTPSHNSNDAWHPREVGN